VRKVVTVVFCDVVGSTALGEQTDPEALRALLGRYFERMSGIVKSHGGTVEKFIGDAVMAVFGVPTTHEDDALRACRAAVEMRDAFPELGISGRIGVNTGEVVAGTAERLVTGDAVNVAARLEQAAQAGEVLIGAATRRLVLVAVEVGQERALELKGKSDPVASYPLVAVTGELERRFASPMIGRSRELRRLHDAFSQAVHDRSCQLFTVLGSAGVGKSRLAAEFLASVEAMVFRGRCLSYGEGITYWPVVEVIKQAGSLPAGEAARPLRSLLGETAEAASADEIAWGFRKLLEQRAQDRPVVCVLDDLHWGEETLLDLVEHIADLSRDAPLLLLCMARPELLERKPSWGGGKWNATSVLLEPLDAAETELLLSDLGGVDAELRQRIVQVAEGNPLFVEEMLALVRESADGVVEVPPSIQALLAARLDQLDPEERAVLERGSVEGRVFHRGAVVALADGDGHIDQRLLSLVRKELVRPDRAQLPHEDAYRFRHMLIRDAAYDALPKSARADLHRRFARWLASHGQELVELDEILGYHLEQAARYLGELGRGEPEVAAEGSARLWAAGRRARWRGDRDGARLLLERAVALAEAPDLHLLIDLERSLRDPGAGAVLMDDAAERAVRAGDDAGAALARTLAAEARQWESGRPSDEQEQFAQVALPLLEAANDHLGLAELWMSLMRGVYNARAQFEQIGYAADQAVRHAALAGMPTTDLGYRGFAVLFGPCPVPVALDRVDALLDERWNPFDALTRAQLLAMSGRQDEARKLGTTVEEHLRELGEEAMAQFQLAEIDGLGGDIESASERLGICLEYARTNNQAALLSTVAPLRGRALCALGRFEEAWPLAVLGRDLGSHDDVMTQALWRRVAALATADRGDQSEAERFAREAAAVTEQTDSPSMRADALFDLGEVLLVGGRRESATTAYDEALALYERKQIVPLARRTRERLAAI
jgi:class 3 adenylate cyclase/tetratricopeptide (TPR) repeat protein